MSRRRRLGCAGLVILALVLSATYWKSQYGMRERAAVPDPQRLPGRLFESPSFDLVLWLPYPHQNLALLREALGGEKGVREWLGAVLRLAEAGSKTEPRIAVPSFGPFPVPPAREMTWALDGKGDRASPRSLLVARIYPLLAWIGRSAGAIAGNPWLEGGEVRAFGGPARVSWNGTVWRIAGGGVDPEALASADTLPAISSQPALARVRLGSGVGSRDLPAGVYRLFRPEAAPGDLELALEESGDLGEDGATDPFESLGSVLSAAGVVAVWARGPAAPRTGLAVLFDGGGGRGLPPAAVLVPTSAPTTPGTRRLRLIHERLPSFLRDELQRAPAEPWLALATDEDALMAVRELVARLPSPEALPDRFLWVDLPALRGFVATVVDLMEEVPLFPRRELERWRDVRTALAPLEGFGRLTLLSRKKPSSGGAPEGAEPEWGERPRWRLRLHRQTSMPGF